MNHHLGATRNFDMELCIPQPQFFHHRQARQIYRFYQLLYYFSRYDFPNWRPAAVQHFSFIRATAACEILKFLLRNLYLYFAQIHFQAMDRIYSRR